ncbi:hypothetical protein BP6252_04945 [Coleophoma cylindrospora]|uniref:SnoaL-like domain-containing protein n=1 Tax=Coleophoma cylindrospora TaxID=1849047 RepID=A0A3D8S1Y8_9HELO|nr:hypothetical protein BP6252_04945 [Coleophoma cylindrospora]
MATQQENTERSRALAHKFVEVGTTRKIDRLADIFDPDAMWNIVVDKAVAGYGGSKPATEVFAEATANMASFNEYSFKAQNLIAEGNHVFIDVAVYGNGPGPVEYRQNYAFVLTTSGDKITDVKVWSDPSPVKAWMEAMQKYEKELATSEITGHV